MAPQQPTKSGRSTPGAVWLITVVWVGLLVLWSVLPPVFRAPDEPQHVDLVLDAQSLGLLRWIAPEGDDVGRVVEEAQVVFGHLDAESIVDRGAHALRRGGGLSAAEAPARADRPSFDDLMVADGLLGDRQNQMAQHPPLYYRMAGFALMAVPGWADMAFDAVVGLLRLLSVLLMAPLPWLVAASLRALDGGWSQQVMGALMPFTIPQVAHIGSVVTNDSLLMLAAGVLTLLCCRVYAGDATVRTGRQIGVAALVAMLTKGFALILPLAVAAAYLAAWRAGSAGGAQLRRSAMWAAGIAALAGWWYGENLLRFGSLQPSVLAPTAPDGSGQVTEFIPIAWRLQTQTFWGRIGWAEVGVSSRTATIASIVMVIVVGLGAWRRRPLLVAALVLPAAGIVALTLWRSLAIFGPDGTIRAVQGRYAFLGLVGLCILATWGVARLVPHRFANWSWLLPAVAAVALHWSTALRALNHFWAIEQNAPLREAVGALVAWSPWPPWALLSAVVLSATGVLVTTVRLAFEARTRSSRCASVEDHARETGRPPADEGQQGTDEDQQHQGVSTS